MGEDGAEGEGPSTQIFDPANPEVGPYQLDPDPEYLSPDEELFNRIRVEQLNELIQSRPELERDKVRKTMRQEWGFSRIGSDMLSPVASRLRRIDPMLAERFRRIEGDKMRDKSHYRERVDAYLEKMSNLPEEVMIQLKVALSNGMEKEARAIHSKYNMTDEFAEVRKVLDELRERMLRAGFQVGEIDFYFPRKVLDYEAFHRILYETDAAGPIDRLLAEAQDKANDDKYTLDENEKGEIIANWLQGYASTGDSKPGMTKSRTIDDIAIYHDQYANPADALLQHIDTAVDAFAKKEFFGKQGQWETTEAGAVKFRKFDVPRSIDKFILLAMDKKRLRGIRDQQEVKDILTSYFGYRVSNRAVRTLKGGAYLGLMSNIGSAITQFGDMAFALYEGGVINSVTSLGQSFVGRSMVTRKDIGIERIGQEWETSSGIMKAVDKTFKLTGLTLIDRLGKETLINASIKRLQKEARTGMKARNLERLVAIFGGEANKVKKELADGVINENTYILAFSILSDYQPVSLAEMPKYYLDHPTGRIFYTLKTFTIKMLDAFRREGWDQIAKGNVRRGIWQLMQLAGFFYMVNVPTDWIKDWLYNRHSRLTDVMIDNIFKLTGLTRYNLYYTREKIQEGDAFMGVAKIVMPPLPWFEMPIRDVFNYYKAIEKGEDFTWEDMESVRLIPFVGKELYWWMGKGQDKVQKRLERQGRD